MIECMNEWIDQFYSFHFAWCNDPAMIHFEIYEYFIISSIPPWLRKRESSNLNLWFSPTRLTSLFGHFQLFFSSYTNDEVFAVSFEVVNIFFSSSSPLTQQKWNSHWLENRVNGMRCEVGSIWWIWRLIANVSWEFSPLSVTTIARQLQLCVRVER